jgi:hypothetical protein
MSRVLPLLLYVSLFICLSLSAFGQSNSDDSIEGTVVSSSRETLVVRSDDNQHHLFTLDRDTSRPRPLSVGARVRVNSVAAGEAGVRRATNITQLEAAQGAQSGPTAKQAAPPQEVTSLEREIQRQARRWHVGVRAGFGFDPELFMFGVHSQIGPIFSRNVSFRPSAEFDFGEVTDLIALNLEAVYRLPISQRQGRWSAYVGAGPSLNFIHQSFQGTGSGGRDINFGNFDYETGFNLLTGLQFRKGAFVEAKTALYSHPVPTFRLIVGYTF